MQILFDFLLHLDVHLPPLVEQLGWWSYGVLFLVIFCETGLVFTPFLPGDSLLFVSATLASQGMLNIFLLWGVFTVGCILGDTLNYWVGARFGKGLERSKLLKKEHLEKTEFFYEKYGKKTIILARFIPIVRTFAPFVAGMGKMNYKDFIFYNVTGGLIWVSSLTFMGYFFGRITWVQQNLEKVILGIIVLSVLPPVIEIWKQRRKGRGQ